MKKILGISLVAILAISPMMANATPATGLNEKDPGASVTKETLMDENHPGGALTEGEATTYLAGITAEDSPKYALKEVNSQTDGNAATAGYVKGAYNAIIKGVNAVQDEIVNLQEDVEELTEDYATQQGTLATIRAATGAATVSDSALTITSLTPTSFSNAQVSGDVAMGVTLVDDWENDAVTGQPVAVTASYSNLPITTTNATLTVDQDTTTVAGNIDNANVTETVSVSSYLASAPAQP